MNPSESAQIQANTDFTENLELFWRNGNYTDIFLAWHAGKISVKLLSDQESSMVSVESVFALGGVPA
jgi:hypothetical protein